MSEEAEFPLSFEFVHPSRQWGVIIRQYLFGQYRIQLCQGVGKGPILRECCTYKHETAVKTYQAILEAKDPEAYLESLATPENCEFPGGRIRLDNNPMKKGSNAKAYKRGFK